MLKVIASSVAVAALALAVASGGGAATPAPKPAATPLSIGTLEPFGATTAPFAQPLPEIGRTRSVTPACAALRDLVAPSWAAAIRSDRRFAETRKRLPNYADIADDPGSNTGALRQMALSRLDSDASALLEDARVTSRALGDPRLAANTTDEQTLAERRALQDLYDAQMARANLLNEFVIRERAATAKHGIDVTSGFASRGSGPSQTGLETAAPDPSATAPPGMPRMTGMMLADKSAISDWGTSIAAYVYKGENRAAKTLLPIAQSCR